MLFLILKCVDYSLFLFSRRKEKCLAKKKREWQFASGKLPKPIALAIGCFSFLNPRAFFLFLKERRGWVEKKREMADCP